MQTAGTRELLAELARPTPAYRRQAWLAVAGLTAFIVLYFGLAGWFLLTAWRLTVNAEGGRDLWQGYLVGACAALLALFMLKALFFVNRGGKTDDLEIRQAEQPRLFEFLHQLADQAGAPRPYRVFLSARVNAAVFYDLTLLNLLFPSRKNLEIGLGLVNCLTLGELRAVLAHEFGHFTQGTMAVGRWVYIAQQIAAHLVARRDKLDDFLVGLSNIDLRVAWIGWILRLIVWSIRSLVETVFSGVVIMQRALSREMEMQADLVAVSLTGSDALIHALHRLQAADDAWGRTLAFVEGEHAAKRTPRDAFAIQSRIMERMSALLNEPGYGRAPPVPAERPGEHRVFKAELAQPPQMWLSHPLNHEREANAKRRYIGAPIDSRSAWELFDGAAALREKVTAGLFGKIEQAPAATQDSLRSLDSQFEREHLGERYRGVYFGRSVVRCAASPGELYDPAAGALRQLAGLYPASLADDVERLRTLEKDLQQLRALRSGALNPAGGVLRYRGKDLPRARLPQAIAEVEAEIVAVEARLRAHDRKCRSAHLAAAEALGGGWPAYLRGLLAVLHYADHTEANLRDAQGLLANTYAVVTATRKVSSSGIERLIKSGNVLHAALAGMDAQRAQVVLDRSLLEKLKTASWAEMVGELKLPPADKGNIGDWLKHVDGWVDQFAGAAGALRVHALEALLVAEAKVAPGTARVTAAEAAPEPSRVPDAFDLLQPGKERKRQTRLDWWTRFQLAEGFLPAAARVAAAAGIVAVVLGLGGAVGNATVTIYNGLARPVTVELDGARLQVAAFGSARRELATDRKYRIQARTRDGQLIEEFDADVRGSFASYVYSVAGAAALVEWTAVYGSVQGRADRPLGAPRWTTNTAETMFAEPPRSVRTKGSGATRDVLSGLGQGSPQHQLGLVSTEAEQNRLIATRARWDPSDSAYIQEWLWLASRQPDYASLLAQRLKETPDDVVLLRIEQESAGAGREQVCARHRARAEAAPQSADLRYLATRCLPEAERKREYLAGHGQWPDNGWFAYAAGYGHAEAARWPEAMKALNLARLKLPSLADSVSVDLMRIHRLQMDAAQLRQYKAGPAAELSKGSETLKQVIALESGEGLGAPDLAAYAELGRGNLAKAVQLAASHPERQARLLRLAAASDGATPELVARVVALKADAGIDSATAWTALALAARRQQDTSAYVAFVRQTPHEQAEPGLRFLDALRKGQDPAHAERLLDGAVPELRGHGYSAGAVLLGAKAPRAWRDAANRLLFASERPYFN